MKYKLGNLIEQSYAKNVNNQYQISDAKGISVQKIFIETKADLTNVSLTPYLLVKPDYFAYVTVTSRNSEKITIAYNDSSNTYIVSSSYISFYVNEPEILDSRFLFMYFNRPEFDRYTRFNSWGSARETFSWEDLCQIELDLPPLAVQQKYVAVYQALLANQRAYESGLDELKLVCDGYVEHLQKTHPLESIGQYLNRSELRNYGNPIKKVMGLSVNKTLREPTSKVDKNNISNYKILKKRSIAFVPTTDSWKVFAYALNNLAEDVVVSPIYEVFSTNEEYLLPEYLAMFFNRKEFDRYVRYHSWGSARENFNWEDLCNVQILIPDLTVQQAIVDIYNAWITRSQINVQLKQQIKAICPVLVRGAMAES